MASLNDYLDSATLRQLQGSFGAAAGAPVWICDGEGKPLLPEGPDAPAAAPQGSEADHSAAIVVDGATVGLVRLGPGVQCPAGGSLLKLMAQGISQLCGSEKRLGTKAEELAAMFSLTAEFTGQRDLQSTLDVVVRIVLRAMRAKGCSIRLLNESRTELVIKSVANLSPRYLNKGPILVSESKIDQEVLSTGRPIYIADERSDERVLYRKEAQEEGLVSALCAPLIYKGHPEGVIRVYTGERHEFDWFEIALLQTIAGQAAAAIANARLYEDAVNTADIKRQLKTASEVQRRLTPAAPPNVPGLDIAAVYVPCFELGGDFYDFIPLPPDNIAVAVCDVAGKGIPASLLMASIRASLRAHAMNIYDMSMVLDRVNRDLCADTTISDFATLFYGVIDYKTRLFTYANAGHVPPLLLRGGHNCPLTSGGGVLGLHPTEHWRHEHMTLAGGDVVLAFTDGLTDAMNHADEPFGAKRIEQAAQAAIAEGKPAGGIARHILWEMRRFAGLQSKFDDLTLVVIRVT